MFVGSVLVVVFSAMKSTDIYKEASARAKADPAVIEALGSPIKDGFLVSGNTNLNGPSGESNLAIPISGPKAKGTIYLSANKSLRQWNYSGARRGSPTNASTYRCPPKIGAGQFALTIQGFLRRERLSSFGMIWIARTSNTQTSGRPRRRPRDRPRTRRRTTKRKEVLARPKSVRFTFGVPHV